MTAVFNRVVRYPNVETGEPWVWANFTRHRLLRWEWRLFLGTGDPLPVSGTARTEAGAVAGAVTAAFGDDVKAEVARRYPPIRFPGGVPWPR